MYESFEEKPDIKPDTKVDIKPRISIAGSTSSHSYATPKNKFTQKTQNAVGQHLNIKVCDPDGRIHNFTVWNKDPVYKSVIQAYTKAANLDIRVREKPTNS